jgi:hypothetical protein
MENKKVKKWLDNKPQLKGRFNRLGPTMCASDVTATLDQTLATSGLDTSASSNALGF